MQSLKNIQVNVEVVSDRFDRASVVGIVKQSTGILLSVKRLLSAALERSLSAGAISLGFPAIQGPPVIARMPGALHCAAVRRWHLGYRYPVICFACSS